MIPTRVALTGLSGMVGRHIAAELAQRGISCFGTSRHEPPELPTGCVWSAWDLTVWLDPRELDLKFPDVDALIHVGAAVPSSGEDLPQPAAFDANVRSCLCLAEWATSRNIPVVYLSGAVVYAESDQRVAIPENAAKNGGMIGGFYGFSKKLGEEIFSHASSRGLRAAILRPSSVYGAGLGEGKFIASLLAQAANGQNIKLRQPVEDRINLIHADDVADAVLSALEYEAWGTFNVASEHAPTVREIAQACIDVTGRGQIEIVPRNADRGPIHRFQLDCKAARCAFGFAPKIDLHEGLRRTHRASTAAMPGRP